MSPTEPSLSEAACKILWGPGDYEFSLESDDSESYIAYVYKDVTDSYGSPLLMTPVCQWKENAEKELERMLCTWAQTKINGEPMTKEKRLEIHGGPNGEWRPLLEKIEKYKEAADLSAAESVARQMKPKKTG